jgi:hypothetical protein
MIVSRPLAALALGAALLAPALASARDALRLSLNPADADRDGVVTDAERDAYLGARTADSVEISTPRDEPPAVVLDRDPKPLGGPLSLERRIVPATEFEIAQEHQFQKAWDKKH